MNPISSAEPAFVPSHLAESSAVISVRDRLQALSVTQTARTDEEEAVPLPGPVEYDPMVVMMQSFIEFLFYGEEEETGNPAMQTAV